MTVTPGHLDSILSETFSGIQLAGLIVQSITDSPGAGSSGAPGSVTVGFTGLTAQGVALSDELTVVAIDDTANTVTFLDAPYGQPAKAFTDYVIGYATANTGATANSYLLSAQPASTIDQLLNQGQYATADTSLAVISFGLLFPTDSATYTPSATPAPSPGVSVLDTSTAQAIVPEAESYSGPVAGLQSQYIDITSDSLNITVSTPNWFIHSGGGMDAIAVSSGTNVLDGGTGSNFLTGGSGSDTFYVDDRGQTSDIWSTINNFHSGDAATVWGVTSSDFALSWVDGQGAVGYTGLTLHATAAGVPTASLTLAGFSSADLTDGKLTVSFGTTAASGGLPGTNYMYVHAN